MSGGAAENGASTSYFVILSSSPDTPDADRRISQAARAAGEIRHPDLLAPLKHLVELDKMAPYSSGEAVSAVRLIELKNSPSQEARRVYLKKIAETEPGLFWIDRTVLFQMSALGLEKADVIAALSEQAKNPDFRISHAAKDALGNLERIAMRPIHPDSERQ